MKAARALRWARRRAGLSQRALAQKAGIPQSTIGRIESGEVDPRVGTLSRLLRASGFDLEVEAKLGEGVDRSQIRQLLALSAAERFLSANERARMFDLFHHAIRRSRARGDD